MQTILDESRKGFMLGAAEYLTKPIDKARIIDVIRRLHPSSAHKVLVVEDDSDLRGLLADWLRGEGWKVHTAGNGREGLEAFLEQQPKLVILDLLMPEMDGFEFMDEIRRHPSAKRCAPRSR